MQIKSLQVGQLNTNCYLAWDKTNFETVVIDPGDDADYIVRQIQNFNLQPALVIVTHGHFDHILAVTELKLVFKIPFWMHSADLPLLKRARSSARHFTGVNPDPVPTVDKFVKNGNLIKFGQEKLTILETPGHTPGGISLLGQGMIFTGDTLFRQAVGRTDFRYASDQDLKASLTKLFRLPNRTLVYPGHGEITTIGEEKKSLLK
jgi:glyoxylase-like metal-dependent hydrolase (beta-lactamase superfamily II)